MPSAADLRAQRRVEVEVGKFTFICRRPTQGDAMRFGLNRDSTVLDFARNLVDDWKGVTEFDVFGTGDSEKPLPWDKELWLEWLDDRGDFWVPIADKVCDAWVKHSEGVKEAAGE